MKTDLSGITKLYVAHAQEKFEATPEEWQALSPKINKVQRLRMSLRTHGRYGNLPGASADLKKAWKDLSALIADKQAKDEDVKPALKAVADAEAAVRKELQQARKDLTELLTARQEAMLVKNGTLD
jgi:chromosome segregation ATPase